MSPTARFVNVLLGVWLFISAFLWPHTQAQLTNTWVLGVVCVIVAMLAMSIPALRYVNTALAIWLFISAFALPTQSQGTLWNNVLVAIRIFIASLISGPIRAAPGSGHNPPEVGQPGHA